MLPLDPLASASSTASPIARLLKSATAPEVHAEIERLAASSLDARASAALRYARGALALREGALDAACDELQAAASAFEPLGDRQAHLLARCEAILAVVRRGPRSVFAGAIAELEAIARQASGAPSDASSPRDARVVAVATHYAATATRMSGDAAGTARMLLSALEAASGIVDERAKILNSLGTLYVVMGAFAAAESVLEHAAEISHQLGDTVGEAISHGQLGAAAIGMGDLERARRCLQKQEWLAGRVGDVFGRARALTFLADVAIELGRPDDAREFAKAARDLAQTTTPPLKLWIAYATRAAGRALIDLGDPGADTELAAAREHFAAIGNPLGAALAEWDLARLQARGIDPASPIAKASWQNAGWSLASLGLASRVAQLLRDQRAATSPDPAAPNAPLAGRRASEIAVAAVAQLAPQLSARQEVELIYESPEELSAIAARRTAAQRNLGRLAVLSIAEPGLFVAVAASSAITGRGRALPSERASAALAGELPGFALWVWHWVSTLTKIASDLAALRASLGADTRVTLALRSSARVIAPPFAGEGAPEIEGLALSERIAAVHALEPAALLLDGVAWTPDAEALTAAAGYVTRAG
jgi:tetratricopeptide (TPR) repeat protein